MVEYVKNGAWKASFDKLKKYRYPALILGLGLLLLLLPTGSQKETTAQPEAAVQDAFDLQEFTKEAQTLLSGIAGAGEVKLLLALETDGQTSFLYNTTQAQSADTSQQETDYVLVTQDGDQSPVAVTRSYPKFRGAVVVCTGADSAAVILNVKEALSSLTGLGMDKITVLKSD